MNSLKSLIGLLILTVTPICAFSQTYSLVTSTSTYDTLANATLMDESSPDTLLGYPVYRAIPIGFTFTFQGMDFDSVRVGEDGYVNFAKSDTSRFWISVYDCDMQDFQNDPLLSPILYTTEGNVGNRIFKVEYRNFGFNDDPESDDYANAQLWLYESCNAFEVRIGTSSINSPVFWTGYDAPVIGYGNYTPFAVMYLQGDPAAPVLQSGFDTLLDSPPAVNTKYNFSACNTGTYDLDASPDFVLYPNPSNGDVYIHSNGTVWTYYRVLNELGQIVLERELSFNTPEIFFNLPKAGLYFIQLRDSNGQLHSGKLIRL